MYKQKLLAICHTPSFFKETCHLSRIPQYFIHRHATRRHVFRSERKSTWQRINELKRKDKQRLRLMKSLHEEEQEHDREEQHQDHEADEDEEEDQHH